MNRIRYGFLLVILLIYPMLSCQKADQQKTLPNKQSVAAVSKTRLKIMTFNVCQIFEWTDKTVDAIRKAKPDIVCLQETNEKWEKHFTAELGKEYPHALYRHFPGAGGQGVISKYPIKETHYLLPKIGWFPASVYEAETPFGTIQLLNVHLRTPVADGGKITLGAFVATQDIRLREIKDFCQSLNPALPTIVIGDFNEEDPGKAVKWLVEQGYSDALAKLDASKYTWITLYNNLPVRFRLDHILYSKDFKCVSTKIIIKNAPDHQPVVAVLEKITTSVTTK